MLEIAIAIARFASSGENTPEIILVATSAHGDA